MGRIPWFLGGVFVGSLQVLNSVYETELVKQDLRNQIDTLRRVKNFVSVYTLDNND